MITSTIHVLILVPVFFVMMKERALRKGHLPAQNQVDNHSTLNSRRTLMLLRISALFFSLVLSTVMASAQSSQTLTGTVSDAMCGASHDAGCKCCAVFPRMRQARV